MAKIKLTKGELKRQRDALKQYKRYLPTLQLKKQQLQLEILKTRRVLEEKRGEESAKINSALLWAGLLSDETVDIKKWIKFAGVDKGVKNIAGVDIPLFEAARFMETEYDLFIAPLWVDRAMEELKGIISSREEIKVIEKSIEILKYELRVTTQRVNLFEKIKIPEAEETIRLIKIYIGDQMTNAVGRSKIAKRKIEMFATEGVAV
ncbi:MAG: V-type ATP synthase subunit D [Candidatus Omnitrophica bacterium]|nr:V-type ATP synthase subunit D [Candidatus Omnitrophota bacterium]